MAVRDSIDKGVAYGVCTDSTSGAVNSIDNSGVFCIFISSTSSCSCFDNIVVFVICTGSTSGCDGQYQQ